MVDLTTITSTNLDQILGKFYAEATPKQSTKRKTEMTTECALEYNINSYKAIRSAINRHLHDLGRDLDIVRGREFKRSNAILDGKLKKNLEQGLTKPIKHKKIISKSDLEKISAYLFGDNNPVILRFRVWFVVAIHFVSRGLEFHEQLKINSFIVNTDDYGNVYATLSHETKQKNWQGGIDKTDAPKEKRMYAVPNSEKYCPVKALSDFISKTDPNASSLFNRCSKPALSSPNDEPIWYTDTPIKHYQFTRFMHDISKNAKCSTTYTAHCLRATAIQEMNDAGLELRHIMHMSGHKNEASVRSYNRDCSMQQKKKMSNTLASLVIPKSTISNPEHSTVVPRVPSAEIEETVTPARNVQNLALQSSTFMSSGFISNSSFTNCVFNFGNN